MMADAATQVRVRTRPVDAAAESAGLFGPTTESWRLDREAWLLLGAGPRALLMQLAHPAVAAGVDEHSDFRSDPWARLAGTLRSYLRIVYGSRSAALTEIRRLNALHRSITGPGYTARDPALSLWVHATLVDSTLAVNDAWQGPLGRDRRARFYAESLPLGRAFGIGEAELPADLDAFEAYLEAMLAPGGPVHPGPTARSLAAHVLHPTLAPFHPALDLMPPATWDWVLWPAIGLLPPRLRSEFGLPWTTGHALVAQWLVASWRAWASLTPRGLREMPQARAADQRVRRGSGRGRSVDRGPGGHRRRSPSQYQRGNRDR
jgi:uncharacterized protein (DUF2236 family)